MLFVIPMRGHIGNHQIKEKFDNLRIKFCSLSTYWFELLGGNLFF